MQLTIGRFGPHMYTGRKTDSYTKQISRHMMSDEVQENVVAKAIFPIHSMWKLPRRWW